MDYFIGDTHFGGEDIIRYTGRKFSNSSEMDKFIIKNWNNIVTDNDKVFLVGDFFDNKDECFMKEVLKQLNGTIVLIKGNHDNGVEDFCRNLGIEVIDYPILYNQFFLVSHEPLYVNSNGLYVNIFAHVHDNPMYKTVSNRSYCVSAERINYTPISFNKILEEIKNAN